MLEESAEFAITWIGNMAYTPAEVDALYDAIEGGDAWPDLDETGAFSKEIQIVTNNDDHDVGIVFLDCSVTQMYKPPSVQVIMRILHTLRHLQASAADSPVKMDELFLELACDMVDNGSVDYEHVQQVLDLIRVLNNYLGINRLKVTGITYIDIDDQEQIPTLGMEPSYMETLTMANLFKFTVRPIGASFGQHGLKY